MLSSINFIINNTYRNSRNWPGAVIWVSSRKYYFTIFSGGTIIFSEVNVFGGYLYIYEVYIIIYNIYVIYIIYNI